MFSMPRSYWWLRFCEILTFYERSGLSAIVDFLIDSRSQSYAELLPLFESGEGITIEVKNGFKATTGVRTENDYKFVLQNGKFVASKASNGMKVYYDGKVVSNGLEILSQTEALIENIMVIGVDGYAVTQERNGDVVSFVIIADGEEAFTFSVKEDVIEEDFGKVEEGQNLLTGCTASLSCSSALLAGLLLLSSTVSVMRRRKKDEE